MFGIFGEIKSYIDFLLDKSKSISHRLAVFISIITILIIGDYFSKFTYNIHLSNKLENLKLVSELKNTFKNDSIHYAELLTIEKRLINREHYFDFIFRQASKIDFISRKVPAKSHQTNSVIKINNTPIRSMFWMVISSTYVLLILLIFFILYPIFGKDKKYPYLLVGWFASLIILSLVIAGITWTAYLIPVLFGNPIWNYVLNAIIHLTITIVLVKIFPTK